MARSSVDSAHADQADAAIARVLAAEREARDAIAASEHEAAQIIEDAREQERRAAERAVRRIAKVRTGMGRKLEARLREIDREAGAADPQKAQDDAARARLDGAVARLADELIGARD